MAGNQLVPTGGETTSGLLDSLPLDEQQWLAEQHQAAKEAWRRFGAFSLPGVVHFADRLITAPAIKSQLEHAAPELLGTLGLLFVPGFLSFPVRSEFRQQQVLRSDKLSERIDAKPYVSGDWSVYLAQLSSQAGLEQFDRADRYAKAEDYRLHNVDGISCGGLGYQQWAALSLQSHDIVGPSLLKEQVTVQTQWYAGSYRHRYPSNVTRTKYPVAAQFSRREGRYLLDLDYSGHTPFRPAVRLHPRKEEVLEPRE